MNGVNRMLWTVATLVLISGTAQFASAADAPADLCSLLPTAVVSQMLGATFTGPTKTVAPRPFPGTNEGVDCLYKSRRNLVFRIYVDPSADAATQLFAKLKMYFGSGSTAVSNLGDEAYVDANQGLHVRKGKERFFLDGGGTSDQKREALATGIAGQL
jgi:hypothetical protein